MKKTSDIIQTLLSFLMVLLSAHAVYKDNTDIAIYLVLVALYLSATINITIQIPKEENEENEL